MDKSRRKSDLNAKTYLIFSFGLNIEESEWVEEFSTTMKVWDSLQTHQEATLHVRETRIDIVVRKFEIFLMEEGETIDDVYVIFTTITNGLRSLGKTYTPHEKIKEIIRSLPNSWRPLVIAIIQSKDLKIMDMDEMIGTLRTHGVLLNEDKPIRKGKMIAFKSSEVQKEASNKYEIIEISKDQQLCEKEAKDELYLISKKI